MPSGRAAFALPYDGGVQPNMRLEILDNTIIRTGGGITLAAVGGVGYSQAHVVRGNRVEHKVNPPTFGYRNIPAAITVGGNLCQSGESAPCNSTLAPGALADVVVEFNHAVVDARNGTCDANGVQVAATHTVVQANICEESEA